MPLYSDVLTSGSLLTLGYSSPKTNQFLDMGFPGGSEVKASACNAGDVGLIPGSGRSPGEGNGNSLQYSCLENPMDREAWWAMVHRVTRVGHNFVTKPHHMPIQDMLLIFISDWMDIWR